MNLVFVYGTLKEGFANFGVNGGQRVPGVFRTMQSYPLYIATDCFIPWLVNEPGSGLQVLGQVYEVDATVLAAMDKLEQIDEAGWYTRELIQVQALGAGVATRITPISAFVYFGSRQRLQREPLHSGPLSEFTAQDNARYRHSANP